MAAIIGLDADAVQELCDGVAELGVAQLANLNSPTQIVISGEQQAVDAVIERAPAAGAKRALRLQVGAAFHSALMEPVRERMRALLAELSFNVATPPLAANCLGRIVAEPDDVRDALVTQIASPVRWVDCVRALRKAGVTHFLELGPGRVLSGLVRQIDPDATVIACGTRAKLEELVAAQPELVAAG
jgi:[acyl-carrier-protein] S-malonyltransferase